MSRRSRKNDGQSGCAILLLFAVLWWLIGNQTVLLIVLVLGVILFVLYLIFRASRGSLQNNNAPIFDEKNKMNHIYNECNLSNNDERPLQNRHLLDVIEWFSFEQLCIKYFETQPGIQVEKTTAGADGGVDIILHSGDGIITYVQCKQRSSWNIGVEKVRAFYGAMSSAGVKRGIVMTTKKFTADAIQFAQKNRIELIDGDEFWHRLSVLNFSSKAYIENFLLKTDYVTPRCPNCEIILLRRMNSRDGKEFWGCSNYPRCKYTLQMRASH